MQIMTSTKYVVNKEDIFIHPRCNEEKTSLNVKLEKVSNSQYEINIDSVNGKKGLKHQLKNLVKKLVRVINEIKLTGIFCNTKNINKDNKKTNENSIINNKLPDRQVEIKRTVGNNYKIDHVNDFVNRLIDATTIALGKSEGSGQIYQHLESIKNKASQFKQDNSTVEFIGEKDINHMKTMKVELIKLIAKNISIQKSTSMNKAMPKAKSLFSKSLNEVNNSNTWEKVTCSFEHNGKTFVSDLTPAAQLKLGNEDIFPISYENKGVSSSSTSNKTHAANLWVSDFKVVNEGREQSIFQGIRHAILSPYSLPKGSDERTEGSINRAKEVVSAALFLEPEKMDRALKGEIVDLKLTSISLVTPGKTIFLEAFSEQDMLADQIAAWDKLSLAKPVSINVRDKDNIIKEIKVNVDIAAFNTGVNNIAIGRTKQGEETSNKYNEKAINKLIGTLNSTSEKDIGGWVGEYLTKPSHDNKDKVIALTNEIKKMLTTEKDYQTGGDPYRLARKIALLTFNIGLTPAWNCKSGKDRTGMLDAELKRELAVDKLDDIYEPTGYKLDEENKKLLGKIMLNSGNMEIQKYNTGIEGNKVLNNIPVVDFLIGKTGLLERIGNETVVNIARGGAKVA